MARLEGECTLVLAADMSYIALYLNNGGRPRPGCGLQQVGIEPTTSPVDDLGAALSAGVHRVCKPRRSRGGR